ncbi:prevent-host-death family protein [Enterococcus faecium EnGen0263]|uniref:type II toxin-antitoxin system prevent-host-death family antitoxin n=1 Tax=Enterococcus faecium TaxID=1352 RepID=UPI00032E2684|nr:type II toxin-antitoxin system prevent-host-death family antitoxin [Enterococcus faecium]EOH52472.1 prevent-host-death family protein [Enterococcus faecium EnGen0263]
MMNIKPISELRDYNKILNDVTPEEPLFLTKNGHGKFAVIDIREYEEYEKYKIANQISQELRKAEQSGSVSNEEVMKEFEL